MNQKPEKNIVLIGFMGCGKSSVAEMLGNEWRMDVVEMDRMISEQQGLSIPEIFDRFGEEYFRDLETALLKKLRGRHGCVVSCGGGAPLREENVSEMKKIGQVILLTASPETIYARTSDSNDRPNLKNRKSPEAIAELLEQRRPKYEAAADHIVATDGRTISDICEEILRLAEIDE